MTSDSDSLAGHPPQPLSFRGRELELNLLLQAMCCWEKDILGSHQNGQTFIPLADVLPAVWVIGSPASPRGPFSSTSHLAATGNCLLSFLKKSPSFKHIIFFFFYSLLLQNDCQSESLRVCLLLSSVTFCMIFSLLLAITLFICLSPPHPTSTHSAGLSLISVANASTVICVGKSLDPR